MKNTHAIEAPFSGHVRSMLAEAASKRSEAALIEREAQRLCITIATEAQVALPEKWQIALDGSQIIWETPDMKENENANKTT
jgi:hypothetical protein